MCTAFFVFFLVGYGMSTYTEGGIIGNGKYYGSNFDYNDYIIFGIYFCLLLISV